MVDEGAVGVDSRKAGDGGGKLGRGCLEVKARMCGLSLSGELDGCRGEVVGEGQGWNRMRSWLFVCVELTGDFLEPASELSRATEHPRSGRLPAAGQGDEFRVDARWYRATPYHRISMCWGGEPWG